jgi:integrase
MPWRKYIPRPGKYGQSYHVAKGIQVRRDKRHAWTLFFEKRGFRRNKTFGHDQKALAAAIREAESLAKNAGTLIPLPSSNPTITPTFLELGEQWLRDGRTRWSDLTVQRYTQITENYLQPEPLFQKSLDELRRKDIRAFLRGIARIKSPAMVETVHGVISAVFTEAVDEELVDANPCSGLLRKLLPPESKRDLKQPDPFNQQELDRFMASAQDRVSDAERMILACMAYAGLRLGEALAMRVEHFDPERQTYFVAQSFRQHLFRLPKGGKTRLVDLPHFIVEALQLYVDRLRLVNLRLGSGSRPDLLFVDPDEDGTWPYSQRKVQALTKRLCKRLGMRARNPHDLRHTYATLLLMAHRSPAYVQRQLGHSSIRITLDIYCHWVPGQGREGLEEALGGGDCVRSSAQKPHIIAYKNKTDSVTTRIR